jgi:hypothetical protein
VKISTLFDLIDLNNDGRLSRSELHAAAKRLGWHWNEAPLLAFLDLFTIQHPISKHDFKTYWHQIIEDPMGVYGRILLQSPLFSPQFQSTSGRRMEKKCRNLDDFCKGSIPKRYYRFANDLLSHLKNHCSDKAANDFHRLLCALNSVCLSAGDTALLIIDPQMSFTSGVWMASIRKNPDIDITPISLAFKNGSNLLKTLYGKVEIMFSRCPFPPASYDWDRRFDDILNPKQLYFIKPGNSILFPPTNGFKEWVTNLIDSGKDTLVIGGCTLNSCVRVSAIEVHQYFKKLPLQVVVDLSISGARTSNFQPAEQYEGVSAVESAVRQMEAAGVKVVRCVRWEFVNIRRHLDAGSSPA